MIRHAWQAREISRTGPRTFVPTPHTRSRIEDGQPAACEVDPGGARVCARSSWAPAATVVLRGGRRVPVPGAFKLSPRTCRLLIQACDAYRVETGISEPTQAATSRVLFMLGLVVCGQPSSGD